MFNSCTEATLGSRKVSIDSIASTISGSVFSVQKSYRSTSAPAAPSALLSHLKPNRASTVAPPVFPSSQDFLDPKQFRYVPRKTAANTLGALNPDLYKCGEEGDHLEFPDGHLGRIWFAAQYSPEDEKLTVTLLKVRNLPSRDAQNPNLCDPFVKLFLSPDDRNCCQTKPRRKTCDPRYDESFVFNAAKDLLHERHVRFVVYDSDALKRSIPIGYACYSLKDHTGEDINKKIVRWIDIKKGESDQSKELGEIQVTVSYNGIMEELNVCVVEAKQLILPDGRQTIDTFAKISVTWLGHKSEKTKKTKTVKKSWNPTFNESFIFKLPADKMDIASVCIEVYHTKPDTSLGRIVIGGQVCTKGKALDQWKQMIDKPTQPVKMWHSLHK